MNPAEFANIASAEQDFWWYRGMRRILFRLLDPIVADARIRRALEAGCGTGHFARTMAERYRIPVFPVDLGWNGLQYGRGLGVENLAQADIAALPFPDAAFDLALNTFDFCAVLNCDSGAFFDFCAPVAILVDCPTAVDTSNGNTTTP